MGAEDLLTAFKKLPFGEADSAMNAVQISYVRRDYLAVGPEGEPIFLLEDVCSGALIPRRELLNLSIEFGVTCRVRTGQGELTASFVMVRCEPSAPDLYDLFIEGCNAWLCDLPSSASGREIASRLDALLELFRALGQTTSKSVAGLWAELWLIDRAPNTASAVQGWHEEPSEKIDFQAQDTRIEVKATEKSERIHEIGLDQLRDDVTRPGFLVSVMLQSSSGGTGILELAERIAGKLSTRPELQQTLWATVASCLGNDFVAKLDRRFDESFALQYAVAFQFRDIPRPIADDPRVTSVRFRANLADVASTSPLDLSGVLNRAFRR